MMPCPSIEVLDGVMLQYMPCEVVANESTGPRVGPATAANSR